MEENLKKKFLQNIEQNNNSNDIKSKNNLLITDQLQNNLINKTQIPN